MTGMKTKVPKPLYLVPLLYILIIVFLVFLQFSDIETISTQVSSLSAIARVYKLPWEEDERVTDIQIFGTGFVFSLDRSNPVRITSMDGLIHKVEPRFYRAQEDGFVILMTQNLEIHVSPAAASPGTARICFSIPDYASVKNISLPFSVMREFVPETAGSLPVISVRNARTGEQSILSLPVGGTLDVPGQRITLPPEKDRLGELTVEKTDGATGDALSHWFSRNQNPVDPDRFRELLDNYRSLSVEAWRNGRFDRAAEVWTFPGGEPGFSGELGAALLAETLNTPAYNGLFARADRAAEKGFDVYSFPAAPYLGDIAAKTEVLLREDQERFLALDRMIAGEDPRVFTLEGLYSLAAVRRDPSFGGTLERLFALAGGLARQPLTPAAATGLLGFYIDCLEAGLTPPASLDFIKTLPEDALVPRIKITREGFFLEKEKGVGDVVFSLKTGDLLIRAGEVLGKEIYLRLGRELIYSLIILADPQGTLPRAVDLSGDIPSYQGSVPAEKVYPLIFRSPHYPREYALPDVGPGIWAYGAASELTGERRGTSVRISFRFPVGNTHYLLIQGVEPFSRLQLFGVNWKGDPIFQFYYSGWHYDSRSRSLYIKIQHRREREEIVLFYEPLQTEEP